MRRNASPPTAWDHLTSTQSASLLSTPKSTVGCRRAGERAACTNDRSGGDAEPVSTLMLTYNIWPSGRRRRTRMPASMYSAIFRHW
jgi:hypothetical protein